MMVRPTSAFRSFVSMCLVCSSAWAQATGGAAVGGTPVGAAPAESTPAKAAESGASAPAATESAKPGAASHPAGAAAAVPAPPVVAAPAAEPDPEAAEQVAERARSSFQLGMEAYRQNRFRAAIEHFKEADRLAPSARLSFNIALAYERMSDGPNALAAYRDYLRRSPKAENAVTTSVRISELELQLQKSGVQQLTILSTPPGALILLDDVSRGVTPWTGEIAPGAHRITLRARGFEDSVHTFDMSARHAMDLTYELRPVVSPPPGAVATASSAGSALVASSAVAPYDSLPENDTQLDEGVRWWTWTGLGTSAALLIGSGVLELSRRNLESEARDGSSQLYKVNKWHEMDERKRLSRIVLGVGAAVGVLSGVSLYLDLGSRSESSELGLACVGGDCQLVARETW